MEQNSENIDFPCVGFTKAETLEWLRLNCPEINIPRSLHFDLISWERERESILSKIKSFFVNELVAVRSSSRSEDSLHASNAGRFHSELLVSLDVVAENIERVFESYDDRSANDQVLVQSMIVGAQCSGVGFSHCINTGAPYRTFNWTLGSDTALVTSGRKAEKERVWRGVPKAGAVPPSEISDAVAILEVVLQLWNVPIDLEFAVDSNGSTWLLQCRPLVLNKPIVSLETLQYFVSKLAADIDSRKKPKPFVVGREAVFGNMPDWNPAEILGVRPRNLALTLYKNLITDNIWAYQRSNYGYRNLRGNPLMISFYGMPYIDVRLSFNSFIPGDLDDDLAGRLVDFYMNQLRNAPQLHDKIEFDIVFSCFTFDLDERLQVLAEAGFRREEIEIFKRSLKRLTVNLMSGRESLLSRDASKLDILRQRRSLIETANLTKVEQIYWLLEDGRRYGSLPFAGLARAGFVATQILESLRQTGVLSQEDVSAFRRSIRTITADLSMDKSRTSRSAFLEKYGHLRPGTYDILSFRYDERSDDYFTWGPDGDFASDRISESDPVVSDFALSLEQIRSITHLLEINDINISVLELMDFMQKAIRLREYAKFEFTKNLSNALKLIEDLGSENGFSRDDMSYCSVADILELYSCSGAPKERLLLSIANGKSAYQVTTMLNLPSLIQIGDDAWEYEDSATLPNYITQLRVEGSIVKEINKDLIDSGCIVFIENADPGFDWLFARKIGGFVTCWGGANSHMAIRAAELNIPAVIGVGTTLFHKWSSGRYIQIDCSTQSVEVIL